MPAFVHADLKTRLMLLIALAFAPAFLLYALHAHQQMQAQKEAVRDNALQLVRVMRLSHLQLEEDAKNFLEAISHFSITYEDRDRSCTFLTNDLAPNFNGYSNFSLVAKNGEVICSTDPDIAGSNIAHLPFFIRATESRNLSVGPFEIEQPGNKPVVYIGVPIIGPGNSLDAVFSAAFDLSRLASLPPTAQLGHSTVLTVFDQTGLVLSRYPDPQGWTGTKALANAELVKFLNANPMNEGVVERLGADDVLRLFAYARIHQTPEQMVYLTTGTPLTLAYGPANAAFRANIISLFVVSLLVVAIAWIGSHRLVVRKMRSLIRTTDRIRSGDFSARSGIPKTADEVGQLALAIDSMADSIQLRVNALQRHGLEMEELKSMNDALQACMTQDEVLIVVRQFALRLFPNQSGALYLMHASGDFLEARTSWGDPASAREFLSLDCWAVRRAKTYRVAANSHQPRCLHVQHPPPVNYACVPLLVHGELLGVLHLENDRLDWALQRPAQDQPIAEAAAEHVSLVLANLKLRDTLHAQAMRDGLTGIFNRRYMEETLVRELRNAERTHNGVALIMIDIDHFKRFNDTYGHAAGDALLREFGSLLQTKMRAGDLACRYGGEEFTIVLPGTTLPDAVSIAEHLRLHAQTLTIDVDGTRIGDVTISLGVARFPEHGHSWQAVLHEADLALLQAKRTRNRVVACESPHLQSATPATENTDR